MIQCMIVDDEPLAQQVLEKHISQTEGLVLLAKCFTAAEAFTVLHQQRVDLLFLDIKMPAVNGTDFILSLKDPPDFIFTTAYAEFAVLSYDLHAVDYLLKPVTYERFKKSIDRFLQHQTAVTPLPEKDYLYLKVNGDLIKIYHCDILFAQSMKDYIRVTTVSANYLTHLTMKALFELLPGNIFKRIHRSYVINNDHIQVISKNTVTIRGTIIPIGENYKINISYPSI
jgi:DNA-binding LytR/AlgR family response regulator